MAHTTPQQRSDLARKAAHARWSRVGAGLQLNEAGQEQAIQPTCPNPNPANRHKRPANHADWTATRFCLRLELDSTGAWHLVCPSGLRLPASPAEISLWLDLLALKSV